MKQTQEKNPFALNLSFANYFVFHFIQSSERRKKKYQNSFVFIHSFFVLFCFVFVLHVGVNTHTQTENQTNLSHLHKFLLKSSYFKHSFVCDKIHPVRQ